MTQYHVSASAVGAGAGTESDPFRTIGQAAAIARAGDEVIVHAGTYRESVDPRYGGESATDRIVYRAAEGEPRPVVKGSERIGSWKPQGGGVWSVTLPDAFFGGYNPYRQTVFGDWTVYPDPKVEVRHLGDVYLNGKSFYEVSSLGKVRDPERWGTGRDAATGTVVPLIDPDATVNVWYCEADAERTTIWANFHDADPNAELVEINVRETCFYPSRPFVNYITVRGFEMAQAACPYTPPTADQVGLIGPHWSRGWVIEDNVIHDAKCSAISLGKEISTGDNDSTRTHRKSGYQYQKEAVYKALRGGWKRGVVGGHTVRGNVIRDCGQNGVVGHMGCAFSTVERNHIYRIGTKREFFGWEVAAIKMHAAVDTVVRANRVHDSVLGMWLDWQAQGTFVDANVFYRNTRDVMTEVTHGPITFANNVFASAFSFDDFAQGAAFVNNLFAGRVRHTQVLDRSTPYHFPHATDVAGEAFVYGGDDRYFNNVFMAVGAERPSLAGEADDAPAARERYLADCGTARFSDNPRSLADYERAVDEAGLGDEELYREMPQPVYLADNTYLGGAVPATGEPGATVSGEPGTLNLREADDGLWLSLALPEAASGATGPVVSTEDLGQPRIVEEYFEHADGSPIVVDRDITGAPRAPRSARGPLAALGGGERLVWRAPDAPCDREGR